MKPTLHLILRIFFFSLAFVLNAQTSSITYSTPGSNTFTVPFGVTQITVEVWGSGGRGGSVFGSGAPKNKGYGGGGGGAYARTENFTVSPCSDIDIFVGIGSSSDALEKDSFFNSETTVMAKGGFSVPNDGTTGAAGGLASNSVGAFKYDGGKGADGTGTYSGGGGSSAGNASNGNPGSGVLGGAAPIGGGAGGNGYQTVDGNDHGANGFAGNSPGGGGGGARKQSNADRIGGNGGNGQVKITWNTAQSNPTANNGTNASCSSFSANWNAASTATTYFLDVSTDNAFSSFVSGYNNLNVGNVTTRSVTGLTAGTTYYYRVRASNSCATSVNSNTITYATLAATPVVPGIISGTTTQCPSLKDQIYSISAVSNATTYNWIVPAGWTITSGAGTTSIIVTTGVLGGNITVTAENSCGVSAPKTLAVTVNPSSIDFDGVDDYIDFGNVHNQTGAFTLEAWVLQEVATSIRTIISKGDIKSGAGNQRGYHLVLNNGKPKLTWYNNAGATCLNIESPSAITANKWHHIAAVYNGTDKARLYVDGTEVVQGCPASTPVNGTESFLIGAMYDSSTPTNPKNYFNGFIDEVRIWNIALAEDQIHQMMNQEIKLNATFVSGKLISKDISGGLLWTNLIGYYPMNDGTATDQSNNGKNGTPRNICLSQSQTAPLPYETIGNGDWTIQSNWLHGNVWDIDNVSINNDWSIIRIKNNITLNHSIKTSGLIIESGKTLTVNGDNFVENSWYLELNGTLDLLDDSQLIQTINSDLVTSSDGEILRRQEGTNNVYRYNYWSSPVGVKSTTNLTNNNASTNNTGNTPFSLNMLKNELGAAIPFTSAYDDPGKISTYWLYTYKNGLTYWDWAFLMPNDLLKPGIGYTQKGTGNAGLQQQYIFKGKPNNGTILVDVNDIGGNGSVANVSKTEFLLGNPYPSALDIYKFIDDNEGVIDGSLHLWQQWAGNSHYLNEYQGGYAQINKLDAVKASQFVGISGGTTGGLEGTLTPSRYLPVGQGFIVEIIANNSTVKFKNSQRIFIKESDFVEGNIDSGSAFFKSSSSKSKNTSTIENQQTNVMKKIRLEFNSVVGPKMRREMVLGFSDYTTDGYDYGYDAACGDTNNNDFNLSLNGVNMNMLAYSSITSDKVIPLNFKSSGNNTFEIKATEFENLDSSQEVYLRDNVTGTYFDLRQNTSYKFTSAAGKFNSRFEMVFQSQQKSLGVEEALASENYIYFQNTTNTLYAKKLNTTITKLAIVNMRGQSIMELSNVSQETLSNGIKISNVATGAYVAWFKTETGQVITKKFIVN